MRHPSALHAPLLDVLCDNPRARLRPSRNKPERIGHPPDVQSVNELQAYLVLVLYPTICLFVGNWWSVGARWASENRSLLLPPELAAKEDASGRAILPFKYLLLFFLLRIIAGVKVWQALYAGVPREWSLFIFWGVAAGLAIFALRRASISVFRSIEAAEASDHMLRGSRALWFAILIVGGLSEEVWRGLTIYAFRQNGYAWLSADVMTGCAFAFAHMCGRPARIPAGDVGGFEVLVGLVMGALFVWSGSLLVPILGNVTYYVSHFLWLRRHYSRSPGPERSRDTEI